MIFHFANYPEFYTHIVPAYPNCAQNQSEIILSNSIHTELQMEHVQKFSITALFRQLNTYLLYVINFLFSILYSILSISVIEMEVSLS